jgi:carboxyl-terminal processing protease
MKEKFQFTEADFAENADWIKRFLRKEMYVTAFSFDEARRVGIETDPMVEKAVESLPKAKALLESANRVIVQRLSK